MRKAIKWTAAVVVLASLLISVSISSNALEIVASGTCGENLSWILSETGTLTISGTGDMNDYNSKKLLPPWSDYRDSIENVIVENGVTSIGKYSFYNCEKVKSVSLPKTISKMGECSFYKCTGLKSVEIPNTITSIENYLFFECSSLPSITIPDSVKTIGYRSFEGCASIEELVIPESVDSISDGSLSGMIKLKSLTLPFVGTERAETANSAPIGCLFGWYSSDKVRRIQQRNSVTNADFDAYMPISLESITITGGVIPYNAFENCNMIKEIYISKYARCSAQNAFKGCSALEVLSVPKVNNNLYYEFGTTTLPESLRLIRVFEDLSKSAFSSVSEIKYIANEDSIKDPNYLQTHLGLTVCLCDSVATIGQFAFNKCTSLNSVEIGNNVQFIGKKAFSGCTSLERVEVSDIAAWCGIAFEDSEATPFSNSECKHMYINGERITNLLIPNSVTEIKEYTFSGFSDLKSIILPDSVTEISDNAFSGCAGLENVLIPDSVTSIGCDAFNGCKNLTEITIPTSVKIINDGAFEDCELLMDIWYSGLSTGWNEISADGGIVGAEIHYDTKLFPVFFDFADDVHSNIRTTVAEGKSVILPQFIMKTPKNKDFIAWRANESMFDPGSELNITGNTTIYAFLEDRVSLKQNSDNELTFSIRSGILSGNAKVIIARYEPNGRMLNYRIMDIENVEDGYSATIDGVFSSNPLEGEYYSIFIVSKNNCIPLYDSVTCTIS